VLLKVAFAFSGSHAQRKPPIRIYVLESSQIAPEA
jgi:hypothetical protein